MTADFVSGAHRLPPLPPIPGTTSGSGPRRRPPLPPRSTAPAAATLSVEEARGAPAGSVLQTLAQATGDASVSLEVAEERPAQAPPINAKKLSVAEQLIGISSKDLKENFKAAWAKDAGIRSGPLRWLKRGLRITGLVLGIAINIASRVVTLAMAAAVTVIAIVGMSIFNPGSVWKDPRAALTMMFLAGAGAGAMMGALTSTLGNLLIHASLDMNIDSELWDKALEGNAGAAAVGAGIAIVGAIANPMLWRAAWKK